MNIVSASVITFQQTTSVSAVQIASSATATLTENFASLVGPQSETLSATATIAISQNTVAISPNTTLFGALSAGVSGVSSETLPIDATNQAGGFFTVENSTFANPSVPEGDFAFIPTSPTIQNNEILANIADQNGLRQATLATSSSGPTSPELADELNSMSNKLFTMDTPTPYETIAEDSYD